MQSEHKAVSDIRVIPPLIYTGAIAVAILINAFIPIKLLPLWAQLSLGPTLIILSLAVMPSVLGAFKRTKTTFDVRRQPTTLITGGMFRYSRNPSYLALIVLCIGIAIAIDNIWLIAAIAISTAYLERAVIIKEEALLESLFGEQYRAYRERVRRWL